MPCPIWAKPLASHTKTSGSWWSAPTCSASASRSSSSGRWPTASAARVPLLFGLSIYVVCAFAATFAPNFAVLLALRLTQGLGAGTRVVATAVVRDRFAGRDMAEVMSLIFMVFMAMPIIAPGVGEYCCSPARGSRSSCCGRPCDADQPLGLLPPARDAPPRIPPRAHVQVGYRRLRHRLHEPAGAVQRLAGMFLFGAMFGFVSSSQQIFVDIFGLRRASPSPSRPWRMMAVSSFLNSRIVKRFGMRRLGHFALIVYISGSILLVAFSLAGFMPLWLFFNLLMIVQFVFGWAASNMNSLSMEPLGAVAGTAASVFGFIQTVGGALLGTMIGLL